MISRRVRLQKIRVPDPARPGYETTILYGPYGAVNEQLRADAILVYWGTNMTSTRAADFLMIPRRLRASISKLAGPIFMGFKDDCMRCGSTFAVFRNSKTDTRAGVVCRPHEGSGGWCYHACPTCHDILRAESDADFEAWRARNPGPLPGVIDMRDGS